MKTIKLVYFICPLLIFLVSAQCKKDRVPLALVNNSDQSLFIFINNDWPGVHPIYPDTTLSGDGELGFYEKIRPHRKQFFDELRGEGGRATFDYIGDTLSFVICDVDTLDKYSWQTIRENYMILQRYDLSIYDLQKLDYTLYYPPTETMRNMKMWPAYNNKQ